MTTDPDATQGAVRAALTACRLQTFTGAVWVAWDRDGVPCVTAEGVSVFAPCRPPSWQVAHAAALQAVRVWGPLATGRVCIQVSQGVPVGSHVEE